MNLVHNRLLRFLIIGLIAGFFFSYQTSTTVYAEPFACTPGFYQSTVFGSFKKLDPINGTYEHIGVSSANSLNSIGYNIQDNYIYGINNNSSDELVRLEDDATTVNFGTPTGLTPGNYVAGDMDDSGNLLTTDGTNLWTIDVTANTASSFVLSSTVAANDLVYIDGFLYGTNGVSLYQINVSNGNVNTRALGIASSVYGAGWATEEGKLYFGRNTTGIIYEIQDYTTTTPSFTAALAGEGDLVGNDGASCALASSVVVPIDAQDDNYQVTTGKELSVSAENGLLSNDVPEGVTVDSYTQPSHGNLTVEPDGSYIYTPNQGFVGTDTFTYVIINSVGETATAIVTINILPIDSEDTDTLATERLAETGAAQDAPLLIALLCISLSLLSITVVCRREYLQ